MRSCLTFVMIAVAAPLPMRAQRIAPPSIASSLTAQSVRGPSPGTATIAGALAPSPNLMPNVRLLSSTESRGANWKGGVLLGVFAGAVFGVMVATQAGDEGSERPFSDRLSDGVVAGAMLAVPVTVIFAMLAGEGD